MAKHLILLLQAIILSSCSVLVGRDLPVEKPPTVSTKKNLVVTSPNLAHMMKEDELKSFFNSTNIFNNVEIVESYQGADNKKLTQEKTGYLELELNFVSTGFYEPYCLIFLTIIPCTPPLKWTLAAKATDHKTNIVKKYLLKEDATMITWAFGFLLSGSGKSSDKEDDLKKNMLLNLLNKMKDDSII